MPHLTPSLHLASVHWVATLAQQDIALHCFWFQRELARQTHEIITYYCSALEAAGFPALRCVLCTGGTDIKTQLDVIKQ